MMKYIEVLDFKRLRVEMAFKGIASFAVLAREAGISPTYMRQIAHNFPPSQQVKQKIASVFGIEAGALWRAADMPDTVVSITQAQE
jgi:hypothetical protein